MDEPRIATVRPVAENEATGRVAEIFADIRRTKNIDFVPNMWRVLATNPTELVAAPSWGAITPSWSRDSHYLVFVSVNRSGRAPHAKTWRGEDIWMVARDASTLIQLTPLGASVSSPTWGSDDRVYFVSDRNGQKCIWSLKPLLIEGTRPGAP